MLRGQSEAFTNYLLGVQSLFERFPRHGPCAGGAHDAKRREHFVRREARGWVADQHGLEEAPEPLSVEAS